MRASACLLALICALSAVGARAEEADYALDDEAWNGIGYLLRTAEEAKVDTRLLDTLDLTVLRTTQVLFWLYPGEDLPVDALLSFIEDGGRVIIADDFGPTHELLERLGVHVIPTGPSAHGEWYQGQDGLPILRPAREHFLFFNVDEVVANYPVALVADPDAAERADQADRADRVEPILGFDGGEEQLVMELRHGSGSLLAIGDPSIFINQMLRRFYGNKQFAANVMRIYCDPDACGIRILLPTTGVRGHYRSTRGPLGELTRAVEDLAAFLNRVLDGLRELLGKAPWVWMMALLVLVLALGAGLLVLAPGRLPPRVPSVGAGPSTLTPPQVDAVGMMASRQDADFHHLASALIVEVDRLRTARARPAARSEEAGLLLRIEEEAVSLHAPEPPMVTSERFLRLYDRVRAFEQLVEASRRKARSRRRRGA